MATLSQALQGSGFPVGARTGDRSRHDHAVLGGAPSWRVAGGQPSQRYRADEHPKSSSAMSKKPGKVSRLTMIPASHAATSQAPNAPGALERIPRPKAERPADQGVGLWRR